MQVKGLGCQLLYCANCSAGICIYQRGLQGSERPTLGLLICARAEVYIVQSTLQLRGLILDGLLLLVCSLCCLLWCRIMALAKEACRDRSCVFNDPHLQLS